MRICDGCGTLLKIYEPVGNKELCQGCMQRVINFIENMRDARNEKEKTV